MDDPGRIQALTDDLAAARGEFFTALDAVDPASLDRALIGEWGARELVAHLGYWAGHAAEAIHAVENGAADEFGANRPPVDEVNATVARVSRETNLATVRKREAGSFAALVERLSRMDPSRLEVHVPHLGWTPAHGIRVNGPDHYREHAAELDRALRAGRRG
jgi:hypothetical protein